MSNLNTAKLAIEAEIAHAKKGMAYYTSRVKALEQTLLELTQMNEIDEVPADGPQPNQSRAKRSAVPAKAKAKTKMKSRVASSSKGNGAIKEVGALPSTGKDYWPSLLSEQPQTAPAILASAISRLGFEPTREQIKKLSQRQTFALNTLVKAGAIQDSGTGRERVFFKK